MAADRTADAHAGETKQPAGSPVSRSTGSRVSANRRVARRRACLFPSTPGPRWVRRAEGDGASQNGSRAVRQLLALAAGLALGSGCRGIAPPAPGPWHDEAGYRWRELSVPRGGQPGFAELAPSQTGIRFTNVVTLDSALWNRHLAQGGGVALGDVDGDGLPDVYLTSNEGANALYRNLGDWRFEDITAQAGVALAGRRSTGAVFADVDGDGDLDLLVSTLGGGVALFLNDGHGVFTERTAETGKPLAAAPEYFGLSAKFTDVDGDGAPDLYVCDDFEDPDLFWLNDGTGTFRAVPRLAVRNTSNSSMAVDFSDVDRDGNVDILVVDMLGREGRRKSEIPTHTPLPKLIGQIEDRPQWQRNTLLRNRGDGTFEQIAAYAGIEASDWTWDVLFLDVDLDGYEDVLATTAHLWDVMDADTWERIRTTFTGLEWRRELSLFPKLALRSVAFHNNGDLTFSDVGERWGFGGEDAISHGMATADLDGDGDLDVVVNRLNSPAAVFRNDAGAPRVAVRLRGAAPNTAGAGSKIRVLGGPVPVQQKEVVLGGTYLSGSDPLYTFAAGTAQDLTIEVDWRRRGHFVGRAVKPNREYEIIEPPPGPATARPAAVPAHREAPWFRDVSTLLGHRLVETPFNGWTRQPLLPQALSQLGPGVTWYDVDGDGQEDLLITSGRGGVLAYYRNDRGRFNRVDLHVAPARYDETTALPLRDGKGGTTLLVGQSNYESLTPGEAAGVPGVLAITPGTGRTTPLIPGDVPSVGPLAVADVDGDGDLDLFVGGRVAPGAYPEPVSSRLFRNEGDRFVLDEVNTRLLQDVGMVSAAVSSDVNGDGWPDLIVAPEWGSLLLFLNDHRRFRDATADSGLDRIVGRWNGVTTGDLDGDGRLDILATSLGRHTKYHVDAAHPLFLYFGDFSGSRRWDMVEAQYDDRLHAIAPLTPLGRLMTALPAVRLRTRTFAAYANATLGDVLGPALARAQRLEAVTLDHEVFFNRGGRFEAVPLPAEAQFAPAFYAGVADFDGDGHEGLFLSQNFFPTEIGTPRYDAGRGLLLRARGDGTLEPVPGQVSGIMVYGDQRVAAFADYDGDGRTDLVVSQNGAETKLYHNEHARPGLRVRLRGGARNPHGIGAVLRIAYDDGSRGPAREIHGGSGYWSQDGAVQVLGMDAGKRPVALWIRWPGGLQTSGSLTPGQREVIVHVPR